MGQVPAIFPGPDAVRRVKYAFCPSFCRKPFKLPLQLFNTDVAMDPLTALGLASNVFACISFASDLIKGTIEIGRSTDGTSTDITNLDAVYNQLSKLCDGLKSGIEHRIPDHPHDDAEREIEDQVSKIAISLKVLSGVCKVDCDELLRIIAKLRTKDGAKGKWVGFRTALKIAWEKKSIEELEARLSRTQTTLTLHICSLAK